MLNVQNITEMLTIDRGNFILDNIFYYLTDLSVFFVHSEVSI